MLSSLFLFVALAFGSALAQVEGDDCPFYPGTCPITVDNVVEVNNRAHIDNMAPKGPQVIIQSSVYPALI